MPRIDSAMLQVHHSKPTAPAVCVGRLVDLHPDGKVVIDYDANPYGPLSADRTASVTLRVIRKALDHQLAVLLTFADGDLLRPILFDVVAAPTRRRSTKKAAAVPFAEPPVPAPQQLPPSSVRVGRIAEVKDGFAFVDFEGNVAGPVKARSAATLRNLTDPVLFLAADDGQVVIIGQLMDQVVIESAGRADEVVLKGGTIRIEAERELLLVAGGCKMQFDARGRLVSTADQIVSRARGANKVQGGSVQLN